MIPPEFPGPRRGLNVKKAVKELEAVLAGGYSRCAVCGGMADQVVARERDGASGPGTLVLPACDFCADMGADMPGRADNDEACIFVPSREAQAEMREFERRMKEAMKPFKLRRKPKPKP